MSDQPAPPSGDEAIAVRLPGLVEALELDSADGRAGIRLRRHGWNRSTAN